MKEQLQSPWQLLLLSLVMQVAIVPLASAQSDSVVANPPVLAAEGAAPVPGPRPLTAAPGATVPGEVQFDLDIVYTDGKIFNPAAKRFDVVKLRSYQGKGMDPSAPYVSPTISITPGETIRITLNNKLPKDPTCKESADTNVNIPHCFNGTNLHTHGLWVNPAGNGDNVLLSINPGVSFQYEYKIPPDHPAGTFWYHTHRHGSTAMQVSSGMAGAIIIRGSRAPTPAATGDLDTLLKPVGKQQFAERVIVLQQIQYACRDASGKIQKGDKGLYICNPGQVAGIEPGPDPAKPYDLFSPGEWRNSGRYTTINGLVVPTFGGLVPGSIERWRMVHGGVRDSINLQFRKLRDGAPSAALLRADEQEAFINQNCTGDVVPQFRAAADGLTLAKAARADITVFQPGYRWDLLMTFPSTGRYCVIDTNAPAAASVSQEPESRQLLGFVAVGPGASVQGDLAKYVADQLVAAAERNMPPNVRAKVVSDLRNGLGLASFVPHKDIDKGELTGTQEVVFNIDSKGFTVNGIPFDPHATTKEQGLRILMLGGADEWTLQSKLASHPFHIHVNPFQVVSITDPNGKDVSAAGAVDDYGGTADPQYPGLKGTWKDTLWVKNQGGKPYTLTVRSRYQRYIGQYVLHCHILDHEDQGMMELVDMRLPDGFGGVSAGHH